MAATRTPEEIRRSIEANRAELGLAVDRLRAEVTEVTDWRKQLRKHRKQVLIGAAVAGFVLGGGIAALTGLVSGATTTSRGAPAAACSAARTAAARRRPPAAAHGRLGRAEAAVLDDRDLDRGRDRDRQQRAEHAEQRRAEQHRGEHHERVHLHGPGLDARLDDVVLDLLVDDRPDRPDDRVRREVAEHA